MARRTQWERYAQRERQALCDLLLELGPDQPTLCTGWTTRDLAAHLVARDRKPQALPGLAVPRLHGITERVERATRDAHSYEDLVALVRAGAPVWHPARIPAVDEAINHVEYFIHHEDVRRAQPAWKPRDLDAATRDKLWRPLRLIGNRGFRKSPVGVVAERTDGVGRLVLRSGTGQVVLAGAAPELLLYAFNRREQAVVDVRGNQTAVADFLAAPAGL
ncbi:TIGR03085 family metal-binding protein [Protofrankia symbiont of Coriaria ruscifolia]|uniref:TIGR03085 family metal-binding protein n=1 Tax=Protofrankia symbiont of Coriaria ruscifolia TaxID=1306542 RepID=UPI00104160B5|nr:TIGR03085 family metal-binding protein [Protofrankia symbiont of Coriaria ruscifolia]